MFSLCSPPSPPGSHDPGEAGKPTMANTAGPHGEKRMPETAAAVQVDRTDEPEQLQLRFFAILDGFRRKPPERALWRVLIHTALAKTEAFTVRGRRISAEAVHHVALALYMHADSAGVIHEFSEVSLAEQCRMSERNIRAARQVLNELRVVRSTPRRGPKPGMHRMNLGGLDWPTVRRRAGTASRPDMVSGLDGPGSGPRPDMVSGLDGSGSGPRPDMVSGLDGSGSGPRPDMVSGQNAPGPDMVSGQNAPRPDMVSGVRTCCTEGLRTAGLRTEFDPDSESVPAGRHGTEREADRRPDEPASKQQVAMFMSLQRKHRLRSQHVAEEDVVKWTKARISEEIGELEDLEEAGETLRERKRQVNKVLDDWQPETSPDADRAAVVDWRCRVEQSFKRGNLAIERRHFIADGEAAGVTDPGGEINGLIAQKAASCATAEG